MTTAKQTLWRDPSLKVVQKPSPWLHFIGGGVGGLVGATLLCPLEVVKTGLQSSQNTVLATHYVSRNPFSHLSDVWTILKSVYRHEGTRGLFKGLGPNLVGVIPARAIHFAAYGNGKRILTDLYGKETTLVHLTSAACAGIITSTATNPIWLVKTRMQLPDAHTRYRSSLHCAYTVVREEGVRGLYRGLSASYLGVAEATIQWVIYERLKKELGQRRQSKEVEWTEYIVSASVAKLVAAVVTYPHEVVRTRMREPVTNTVQGSVVYKYRGVFQTLGVVAREEGLRGLYGGLTPHLLRVVPNAAIIFMCYEAVLHFGQR